VLARIIYGARVSLLVAFVSTGLAVALGVLIGTIAGFFGGWLDTALSRIMDVVLAFPLLLLAIGLSSACTLGNGCLGGLIKPGMSTLIIVIALSSWPYIGRIIRGQVLSLREKEFVEAARSLGASDARIVAARHRAAQAGVRLDLVHARGDVGAVGQGDGLDVDGQALPAGLGRADRGLGVPGHQPAVPRRRKPRQRGRRAADACLAARPRLLDRPSIAAAAPENRRDGQHRDDGTELGC
jgi:hypothetical protein